MKIITTQLKDRTKLEATREDGSTLGAFTYRGEESEGWTVDGRSFTDYGVWGRAVRQLANGGHAYVQPAAGNGCSVCGVWLDCHR